MQGRVGDRMVVMSRHVGQPYQTGEILEVMRNPDGCHRYRVRWSDGRETTLFPGSDVTVEPMGPLPNREAVHDTLTTTISLLIEEDREHCECIATMRTASGTFTGWGRAKRNPADPDVPRIGEELAIARSLNDMAARLTDAAHAAMVDGVETPRHLV